MASGDGNFKPVARPGDVMVRGSSGWGPRSLTSLLKSFAVTLVDSLFRVANVTDNSKQWGVSLAAQATATTQTMSTGSQTGSRTLTWPVLAGTDTLAALGVDNTFTGNLAQTGAKTFSTGTGAVSLNGVSTLADRMGLGSANTGAASQIAAAFASTSGTTQYGYRSSFNGQSDATTRIIGFGSNATTTVAASFTCAQLVHFYTGATAAGAGSTITRLASYHATAQTAGGTANIGYYYGTNLAGTGTYSWYSNVADPEFHNGVNSFNDTTDATALGTAGVVNLGGLSNAKTLITAKGQGWGVTNTATHNGATTLVQGSTIVQNFTGTTAGEIPTMPAVNLWGAGIGIVYIIINSSNQTITPTRAGSDTFQGGGTTSAILAGAASIFIGDGVSVWLKASVS